MTDKLILICLFMAPGLGAVCAGSPFPPFPEDLPQPKPKQGVIRTGGYSGKVTAVGVDWLELGVGWRGEQSWDAQGREIGRRHDNTNPKRISAAGTTPGGDRNGLGAGATYRLTDLQVGDVVSMKTGYTKEEEWTMEILIHRRPGGKIPPKPGEGRPDLRGWHMEMQAEQDWEEKRIPIPAAYLRNGEYPWTNPPYPLPTAPLPREVKP